MDVSRLVLFSELPFCGLDSGEIASEFQNDGNDLLELGQNIACGVYANQYDIINPLGESQAPANNDLITERNKYNKDVLMCHLNINSIQNKLEEIASLIKKSRTQLMIVSESNIDSSYPNSQFTIPGYGLHRNDRKKRGGGILAYVSSELICKRIKPVKSYKTIEVIVLDIMG